MDENSDVESNNVEPGLTLTIFTLYKLSGIYFIYFISKDLLT